MRRKPLALAAGLIALALPTQSAHAAPALAGTFNVSGMPGRIAAGPDGNVWFILAGSSANKEFGRITPDGTVTEYDSPGDVTFGGITAGPDGNVWATAINEVVKIPPSDPTTATAFTDANIGGPSDITTGPDGHLWTGSGGNVIEIDPAHPGAGPGGTDVTHTGILSGTTPLGIATGGDGNLWIIDNTSDANSAIVRFNTAGVVEGTPAKAGGSLQQSQIAAGPAGQLAFTQPVATNPNPQRIGRIDYAGNIQFTNMPGGTGVDPTGIVFGNDGAYWTADFAANKLGRLTPAGDFTQPVSFDAGSGPRYLAKAPNDTLWVSLEQAQKIAKVTGVSAPPPSQPPPVGPPPVNPAPAAVARVHGHVFSVSGRFVTIPLACPSGAATNCTGTIALQTAQAVAAKKKKKRKLKLGSVRFSIGPGRTGRARIRLSSTALKLVRKKTTVKAVATVTTKTSTTRANVTLKAPKRKK